ncbi:MAG: hypothetical protein J6X62_07540 [Bacteroidales bacterium]|nr:hypothetical protein [Bacteroidales bacterium]
MPLFKNKVWGGNRIARMGFDYSPLPNCGELWALSGVEGNESVVSNGFLAENTLSEVLEIYMGELVGDRIYERYGDEFPLLVKLIDACDRLSIQVHPDDKLAQSRGMENGKSEMWYILEAEQGAALVDGFAKEVTREEYQHYLAIDRSSSSCMSSIPSAAMSSISLPGVCMPLAKDFSWPRYSSPATAPTVSTITAAAMPTATCASCTPPKLSTPSTSA